MFCEPYREALTGAALSGEQLPSRLKAHLEACVSCRAAFSDEKALLAQMHAGVRRLANAEIPASLWPAVRERIAAGRQRHPRLLSSLAWGTALAALSAIAFLYGGRGKAPSPPATSAGCNVSPTAKKGSFDASAKLIQPRAFDLPLRPNQHPGGANHFQHEVLISEDEQNGLRRYEEMLRDRAGSAAAAGMDDAPLAIRPLEIAELEVKELSIEPLVKIDAEEASMKR